MTLRTRLTWILLAALLPLGIAVGVGLYTFVRLSLYARLDDGLAARAEALAAAVKWHDGELEFDLEDVAMPQYQPQGDAPSKQAAYFEVWRLEDSELGPVVARSRSMGAASLADRRRIPDRAAHESTWNADLSDETDVRVLAVRTVPPVEGEEPHGGSPETHPGAGQAPAAERQTPPPPGRAPVPQVLIVVAVPRESVDRPLEILAVGLVLAGAVLGVAGFASLRWAVVKGLAPVNELAEQVSGINPENLVSRLAVPRLPPEVAPIQDRVNALLSRIEAAMQREKRFTSAAAHELRTPIAELRMLLEVAASQQRTSNQWSQTADRALAVVLRAQGLCEALLRLARASDPAAPGARASVDIPAVIAEQVRLTLAMHHADPMQSQTECPPDCTALADPAILESILRNLLDNAFRHGSPTADNPVRIRCSRITDRVLIQISNPAPGIDPEDSVHLFEPFWRKDLSRHDQQGFGLGLTVARLMAQATGGDLRASIDAERTLKLCLELQSVIENETPAR